MIKRVFKNDPFSMLYEAFQNLFPDKQCECHWVQKVDKTEDGKEAYGYTEYYNDSEIYRVCISVEIPVENAIEILGHELAHVAVGIDHDHDEVWDHAFDEILN